MGWLEPCRSEFEHKWTRLIVVGIVVLIFGIFSSLMITLVATEACADTFAPLGQTSMLEWRQEGWTLHLPVCVALLVAPLVTSLVAGINSINHGGMLAFAISLFNLIPLRAHSAVGEAIGSNPAIWVSLGLGLLLAFYIGDLASLICRRRIRQQDGEEEYRRMVEELRLGSGS